MTSGKVGGLTYVSSCSPETTCLLDKLNQQGVVGKNSDTSDVISYNLSSFCHEEERNANCKKKKKKLVKNKILIVYMLV